ncbi:MOSC domain-containing protein [Nocardioides zeae]|uniref:MOSC domain-containing protein n=1 Tax=Nocardioides imazamoxiresistens TaxID=3231893 RepID=A0ABU3PXH9_9ACTN|nr:MOSC N-terminal beta barrel domain-containing protein [Nocardioides zeae]MDT9593934.1 MOSC domain-containing protein [Nocardioides zeae]
MALSLVSLHHYPVKSLRGTNLPTAVVEPWGLAGDRRWMLVEAEGPATGTFVSARKDPRMLPLHAEAQPDDALVLRAPDGWDVPGPLHVPVPPPRDHLRVDVWGSELDAAPAGPAADAWLSAALGRPVRLVHLDDPTRRPTSPAFSEPDDRVSFADGFPVLLTTLASLRALNDDLLEASQGAEAAVAMDRFRPNVVVDGDVAWAEDDWRRVRIGDATFRAVKGCARCVLTTVDPATAEKGREPLRTLARTRRFDQGVWFGVNLVPDAPFGTRLQVGDPVEVLEAVLPGEGPLRSPA